MQVGKRVGALMEAQGMSQAELGRRVGMTQPSVYALLRKNKTGSRHLHKVARVLGTTTAYLTGEIDDPSLDALPEPEITFEERELIHSFRLLAEHDRAALVHLARSLADRAIRMVAAARPAAEHREVGS